MNRKNLGLLVVVTISLSFFIMGCGVGPQTEAGEAQVANANYKEAAATESSFKAVNGSIAPPTSYTASANNLHTSPPTTNTQVSSPSTNPPTTSTTKTTLTKETTIHWMSTTTSFTKKTTTTKWQKDTKGWWILNW